MANKKLHMLALPLALAFAISTVSPASATTATITLTLYQEVDEARYWSEELPTASELSKVLKDSCASNDHFWVGAKARAVSERGYTVGLGKVKSYKLGSIFRAVEFDPMDDLEYFTYFAPCVYSVSIPNIRKANFYHFFIGTHDSEEFDSKVLAKKKWKISLTYKDFIACSIYEEAPPYCSY